MISKTAIYYSYEVVGKIVACVSNAKAFSRTREQPELPRKYSNFISKLQMQFFFFKLGGFCLFRK